MAHIELKNRFSRFKSTIVNNNLEFDILSGTFLDFDTFSSPELLYIVEQPVVGRIDLISFEAYGTVDFWWLIGLRNKIIDPINELTVGQQLFIPAIEDYYDWFNTNIKVEEEPDFIAKPRTL